ncbi:hyaluronidase-like [Thrips palmi]|uniref:Hyaluronidase n=1 Tax=Thrips palmi TaxID=161013 RepID=A0A6P8Y6L9_THRPL|nr:hyaluronidase-like [Thrips palmi]
MTPSVVFATLLLQAMLLACSGAPADVDNNIYPLQGSPPPDLGPQRPHGQFPPSAGPPYVVDLGPQRPHGQSPPNDAVVEVKALAGGTGPHRPAGPRDPNLTPNDDLSKAQSDPGWRPVRRPSVDLGPHRPAGMTDPNGPPGSNGPVDLGPQRPSGQFPPGAPRPTPRPQQDAVQDDDSAASGFRVYWNVPSFMCHKHGYPFSNLSGRYGMVQNEDDVFRGTKITILYDPGLFPALVDNDGSVIARNGGVPQEGNLELHLQRLKASIEDQVPVDFDGLGVIDFEAWRPVWAQNFGTLRAYQSYSVEVERARSPTASNSTLTARATRRFEAAAKVFFLRSLALAQQIRPNGRWGYYAFPYCFNSNDDNFDCSDNLRTQNSQIQWLFNASTALFPSVYLSQSGRDRDAEFLFIQAKLKEAKRVAQGRNVVYPYLWYRYRDASFLSDDDLRSSLALPRALGFAGAIMWGSSGDMNTASKCQTLNTQLEDRLGPEIREYSVTLSNQAVREYVQKRNESATASRSRAQDEIQFSDQRPLYPLQYSTL